METDWHRARRVTPSYFHRRTLWSYPSVRIFIEQEHGVLENTATLFTFIIYYMPHISARSHKIIVIIASILVLIVVFCLGMIAGYHGERFSQRWDRHYSEVMNERYSAFGPFSKGKGDALVSHGAVGQVIAVNFPSFVVRSPQEVEKVVIIDPQTAIRRFRNEGTSTDVTIGSWVIALGSPDEKGEIHASLIRIMPPPPGTSSTTASTTRTIPN